MIGFRYSAAASKIFSCDAMVLVVLHVVAAGMRLIAQAAARLIRISVSGGEVVVGQKLAIFKNCGKDKAVQSPLADRSLVAAN